MRQQFGCNMAYMIRLIPAASAATAGLGVACILVCGGAALAGPVPDYDFQWATVGAAGNRPANIDEAPGFFPPLSTPALHIGRVDYEFRIARTEVTVGQWFEFAEAFWPHWGGSYQDVALTGRWITPASNVPGQDPGFQIVQGAANRPADTSWIMAARYVNWLHNGKGTAASDFENGVYDISTVVQGPGGAWGGPETRAPDATFWLPSNDEWTKAMFYDPNKNGPGQEGYWRYPHTSDNAPISGLPWEGGETSAGEALDVFGPYLDVGSYPNSMSPWGLLDGSGSEREWAETAVDGSRVIRGSRRAALFHDVFDSVDYFGGSFPNAPVAGFRVASVVPAPSGFLSMGIVLLLAQPRGRRSRKTRRTSVDPVEASRRGG